MVIHNADHNAPGDETSDPKITFGSMEKLVGVLLAIGAIVASIGGNYFLTSYRLNDHDKRLDGQDIRIGSMEALGHPDHERRITKLEARDDANTAAITALAIKLDVAISTLERLDKTVSQETADRRSDQRDRDRVRTPGTP